MIDDQVTSSCWESDRLGNGGDAGERTTDIPPQSLEYCTPVISNHPYLLLSYCPRHDALSAEVRSHTSGLLSSS